MMTNNTAVIFILLSIGLYYTFTSVQYQEVKDLQAQASEYKNILENAQEIFNLRDALQTNYAAIPRTEIERLNKVLPDTIDTMQLALDLDGVVSRYGVSLKSVRTTTEPSVDDPSLIVLPEYQSPYGKATVFFSFVSTYDNFKKILSEVEKGLRLMDIKIIAFQVNPSASLYEFQITADTYWLK